MKAPKLIAFDMDGTLLNEKSELSQPVICAIKRAQQCGLRIAVATGRMFPSAMIHLSKAGIETASIFYNGALIREPKSGKTIFERNISPQLTSEILAFHKENNWYVQIYCDDRLIVNDDNDRRCKYYESICLQKARPLGDEFWNWKNGSSKMLSIAYDEEEFRIIPKKLAERFGKELYLATSWGSFVEMVDIRINKAKALERIGKHYGIEREEIMAVGDGNNDIEMIKWAGIGVAMGNARENVKQAADFVAPPNNEDGTVDIIEKAISAFKAEYGEK